MFDEERANFFKQIAEDHNQAKDDDPEEGARENLLDEVAVEEAHGGEIGEDERLRGRCRV